MMASGLGARAPGNFFAAATIFPRPGLIPTYLIPFGFPENFGLGAHRDRYG